MLHTYKKMAVMRSVFAAKIPSKCIGGWGLCPRYPWETYDAPANQLVDCG